MPSTCGASLMALNLSAPGRGCQRCGCCPAAGAPPSPATTTVCGMRVAMMTREYPPEVYGGAGVHVTELVAQLRHLCEVDVRCMGAPRPGAFVRGPDPALRGANPALDTLSADLAMADAASSAPVARSHPWYPDRQSVVEG